MPWNITRHNSRLVLNVAFNYGGRDEIVNAIQHMHQPMASSQKMSPMSWSANTCLLPACPTQI